VSFAHLASGISCSLPVRHLLSAVAHFLDHLARGLDRAARRLESAAGASGPQLLPADLLLEDEGEVQRPVTTARSQPPPIPAAARLPLAATKRRPTDQERAWQELASGRSPRLTTRALPRPAPSAVQ
jgi:hypothetical protein